MRAPRNTTELNRQEIIDRFLAGESGPTIGERLGLDKSSITKRLKLWGIVPKQAKLQSMHVSSDLLQTDVAWAAGFFDGEGSICILFPPPSQRALPGRHRLTVSVTNTVKSSVALLRRWFGGNLCEHNQARGRARKAWMWSVSGLRAGLFLSLVEPYLTIKRGQANAAIMFAETLGWSQRGKVLSDEALHLRALCRLAVKQEREKSLLQEDED